MSNATTFPSIPPRAMWSTMEHLAGWYASHVIPGASYVDWTGSVLDTEDHIIFANFRVYNEVSVEIGKVTFDRAADGDGWSFSAQCKARNASGSGRCQRIAPNALCAHHQDYVAS